MGGDPEGERPDGVTVHRGAVTCSAHLATATGHDAWWTTSWLTEPSRSPPTIDEAEPDEGPGGASEPTAEDGWRQPVRGDPMSPSQRCEEISDPGTIRWDPDVDGCRIARAFVIDDHEIVRRGLNDLLAEEDLTVVGEAATADEALREISLTQPDIVIVDLWVPDDSALDVCRVIRQRWPEMRRLMPISVDDDRVRPWAVAAGIGSCVPKDASATEFVERVKRACRGEMVRCSVTGQPIARPHAIQQEDDLRDLTAQELRILDLVGEGLTNRQIGSRMHLAEKTVKNYVSNLLMKLGMCRRTEAAALIARLHERHRLAGP